MLTRLWHPSGNPKRSRKCGLSIESLEERCLLSGDVVLQWNQAVLNAIRADKPTIGFLTRDLAIVHTAIYDAVNAIDQTSSIFHVTVQAPADASPEAAAAAAALYTAAALFPIDLNMFQATFQSSLADIPDGTAKDEGIEVGRNVAEQTLISRIPDGADTFVSYTPGTNPGDWRPAPPAFAAAQTPQWPFVTPFALDSSSQFRPPAPPALTSQDYTDAFNEVKDFGRVDSTVRTHDETEIAQFWEGKAGTPNVPGYWNEIAESAALSQGNTLDQNARLFAELNVALADGIIAHFDAKYTYNRWRPVTAIHLADQTGNPDTVADPNWLPLLNTPANPAYVSGHAVVSAAASTILAQFFGTDNVSFDLTSEDLSGVTHSFTSFSAAASEAENSVVWGGIHFRYDVTTGDTLGQSVAQFVTENFFQPPPGARKTVNNGQIELPGNRLALSDALVIGSTGSVVDRKLGIAQPSANAAEQSQTIPLVSSEGESGLSTSNIVTNNEIQEKGSSVSQHDYRDLVFSSSDQGQWTPITRDPFFEAGTPQ
jgi:hypothetical protein